MRFDIAEFDGDDPIDNFKYLCKTAMRYLTGADEEVKRLSIIQAAVNKLNETQDQTGYYRQMEKLEAQKKSFGVTRWRRHGSIH